MHRLAHAIVASKGERKVAHATRNLCVGAVLLNVASGIDKGLAISVVFLDSGCNGEDIGVKNYTRVLKNLRFC